jgi:hypothetical protein
MGFGIILIGYIASVFDFVCGGIVGYPLMAYGMFRLSRLNGKFAVSGAISLALLYDSVWNLLIILGFAQADSIYRIAHTTSFAFELLMIVTFYLAVKDLADGAGSASMSRSAVSRMIFNCIAYIFTIVISFVSFGEVDVIITVAFIIAGIINALFMFDCCAKITTNVRQADDMKKLRDIQNEERMKQEKRRMKEKSEFEDRRKR